MTTQEQEAWKSDRYSFFQFVQDLDFDPRRQDQPTNQFKIDRMVRFLATLPPVRRPRGRTDIGRFLVKFIDPDNQIAFVVMPESTIADLVGDDCMREFKTVRANVLKTVEGDESWVTHNVTAAIAPSEGNKDLAKRWLQFWEQAFVNQDAFDEFLRMNITHITDPKVRIDKLFVFLYSPQTERLYSALMSGLAQIYGGRDRTFQNYNGDDKKVLSKLSHDERAQLSFIDFHNVTPAGFWNLLHLHEWDKDSEGANPNWFPRALTAIGSTNKAMFFAKSPEILRKYLDNLVIVQFKDDFDETEIADIQSDIEADTEGFTAGLFQVLHERASEPPPPPSTSTPNILGELNTKFQVAYDIIQTFDVATKNNIWHESGYNINKYLAKEGTDYQITDDNLQEAFDHLLPKTREAIKDILPDWEMFKEVLRGFGWIDMKPVAGKPKKMKISQKVFMDFRNKSIERWRAEAIQFAKKPKEAPPAAHSNETDSDSEPEPPKKKPAPKKEEKESEEEEESTPTGAEDN